MDPSRAELESLTSSLGGSSMSERGSEAPQGTELEDYEAEEGEPEPYEIQMEHTKSGPRGGTGKETNACGPESPAKIMPCPCRGQGVVVAAT
jgi:hypothetical protein